MHDFVSDWDDSESDDDLAMDPVPAKIFHHPASGWRIVEFNAHPDDSPCCVGERRLDMYDAYYHTNEHWHHHPIIESPADYCGEGVTIMLTRGKRADRTFDIELNYRRMYLFLDGRLVTTEGHLDDLVERLRPLLPTVQKRIAARTAFHVLDGMFVMAVCKSPDIVSKMADWVDAKVQPVWDAWVDERRSIALRMGLERWARRVIEKHISDNLESIKTRLWRPSGELMRRRFAAVTRSVTATPAWCAVEEARLSNVCGWAGLECRGTHEQL